MTGLDELIENLKRAGAGQAQIDQETRNFHLAQKERQRPRHERATPFCALETGRKFTRNPEQQAYYRTDPAIRAAAPPEPTADELRREISREHRRLSKDGGDPGKLTELLKKRRAK